MKSKKKSNPSKKQAIAAPRLAVPLVPSISPAWCFESGPISPSFPHPQRRIL